MKLKCPLINHCRTSIFKKAFRTGTSAAVLLAVSLSLLTGCGGKAPDDTVTADGKVQVRFWYSGGKTAAGVMEDIIEDFNLSQSEYTVIGVQQADYDETYTKLQALSLIHI